MRFTATKAARILAVATEVIATLLLIFVTILNLTQVVGRYFFSTGFSWTEEAMRFGMIWLMMLGSVACIFRVEHMGIEMFEQFVGEDKARYVKSATYSIAAIFCVLLLYYGLPLALRNAAQTAPASGIPMIYPYLALPIGAFLMLVQISLSWFSGFEPDDEDLADDVGLENDAHLGAKQ